MSIRIQLTLSYIGIVLLVLFAMYLYLGATLKASLSSRITDELEIQAALSREFLLETLPKTEEFTYQIDTLVDRLGKTGGMRLTFIDVNGRVWGDTERDAEKLHAMDNHLSRPEVQEALEKGRGIRDRYSTTTETEFRYFAVPIEREGKLLGICRVALPMEAVNSAIFNLWRMLLFVSVAGLLLAILFSIFTTGAIVKPIQKLTQTTQSLAAGKITSRVPVDSANELGQLSRNFNLMANRVQGQIHRISQAHHRLETILTNMGEGVLLLNGAYEVTYANPAAIAMLTLPEAQRGTGPRPTEEERDEAYKRGTGPRPTEEERDEAYIGKALIELNRKPELQALLKEAAASGTVAFAEIRLGNLMEPEAEVTVVPITSQENRDATLSPPVRTAEREYLLVIHDVSQVRQLERIRADFVANVSHELRTPLTSIQGYAETLLNSEFHSSVGDASVGDASGPDSLAAKKREEFIIKILNHAARLSRLVSELLELSRLESGDVELERAPCHLNAFHAPILDVFEPVLEESGVVLEWDTPETLPKVNVDRQLFTQVFVNLIDNAIKYTPDGGAIRVSAEVAGDELIVRMADTGIGIPLESQSRVFERFYRVDKGRAREMGGTGLGLAITKHIVLRHGGRIWLESTLGQGTVFHVALPNPDRRA